MGTGESKRLAIILLILWGVASFVWVNSCISADTSGATEECLECHISLNPGLVASWQKSQHAQLSPQEALQKTGLELKVSGRRIPEDLTKNVVGCAECHTMNAEKHKDTFEHNGHAVHIVVTPTDCATCHPVEADQYTKNLMSFAYGNLVNNPTYQGLILSINGGYVFDQMNLSIKAPNDETNADSCLFCHGTSVEVKGVASRETEDYGELEFPVLSGWPNQGVGRLNPDGSKGSCSACHTRHQFSIEVARKPYTCSECHKGPDVPAYKVYQVSKHGNIFSSVGNKGWNFKSVPWVIGKDFTAPTCATCHISLLTGEEGNVVVERTHQINNRIPWRIFGLIYAHPHPKAPDTTVIKNKDGLFLPTALTGERAVGYLIDAKEQEKRRLTMQGICLSCHGREWVDGHWSRFENTIGTTNESTLTATQMMLTIWDKGFAEGLPQKGNLFDESVERRWANIWLLYANHIRLSSAMCGGDYGVFDRGRYFMTGKIQEIKDWLDLRLKINQ
jgi:hypothetical protein